MKPKVSVIIPVYNGEKTIKRAINSCLSQTYDNVEVIVIDNASTDSTREIVTCIDDSRLQLIELDIKGRSNARNVGLDRASGKYFQLLDADDTLANDKIELAVEFMENNPNYLGYASSIRYIKNNEELEIITPTFKYKNELLNHNVLPINSLVYKKNNVRFDKNLEYDEDWKYWVDIFHYQDNLIKTDAAVGGLGYITGENTMNDAAKMMYYEIFVRGIIRNQYPKIEFKMFMEDIKKLLTLHSIFSLNKISYIGFLEAERLFKYEKTIASLLFKILPVRKKISSKVTYLLNAQKYQ